MGVPAWKEFSTECGCRLEVPLSREAINRDLLPTSGLESPRDCL